MHMSLEDRCKIEKGLNNKLSFKSIANEIGKNCTTISREIRNHYTTLNHPPILFRKLWHKPLVG